MASTNSSDDESNEGIESLFDPADLDVVVHKTPKTGKKVLVVDDSEMMRLAVCAVVKKMGHDTVEAADGAVGLSLARNQPPDLVILDLKMPTMDGIDVLRAMRDDPKLKATPVIILTMKRDRQNVRDAVAEKVTDFLLKPVAPVELRKRIRKYIG
jgi:two-component system chemotaxis response regulator CheY